MWALLSILAAAIWATCNVIDKVIVKKKIKNPFVTTIVLGIVGLLSALVVSQVTVIEIPSLSLLLGGIVAGMLYFLGIYFYFDALKSEEVSRVVSLFFLKPVIVLFLATVFLSEFFTLEKYIGIFILVGGSFLSSLKIGSRINISRAFYLMLFFAVISAPSVIITKYLLNFLDYWTVFFWERLGTFIGATPAIYFFFGDFQRSFKKRKAWGGMLVSESLNVVALFLVTVALSLGFASLVSGLTATQPLFSLIYALSLGTFLPVLKEERNRKVLAVKLLSISLIILGSYLII